MTKEKIIYIRVSGDEKAQLNERATEARKTLSEFLLDAVRTPSGRNPQGGHECPPRPDNVRTQEREDLEVLLLLFQRNAPLRDFTTCDLERVKQILARVKATA